ncbi:MAG: autotransporter outer membrane beta-barrel domain-containing protein, partial [gamma proteobacterium symbiont of Bathyaustriella thionipta]|nr:autotransporter outer membrane beta-barrel domain-containing protein [gamma proteobacterium symbiont of Bathyaustriella thionipta]MCU7950261.1 autotransporter outer membrane beta-barrel domain-containing protein [gamma proteobacterium symbiont of Bathyaustriella thionipta]MCU7954686.1 autotransporter outer membrane beta-barrel domain-containing protein [gamma proteobacterium symbiont of Bathyaustriella thionipta]MCU7956817.1 autotransporter outer membrane beta-barrel domain-containing protein
VVGLSSSADGSEVVGLSSSADGSEVVGLSSSADGSEVVGLSSNANGGAISLNDLSNSLGSNTILPGIVMNPGSLTLHGAHSNPLSHRVNTGESCTWVTGDWGKDRYGDRDGSSKLAEISACHNFGAFQLNLSLGKSWSDYDLLQNGELDADNKFVVTEFLVPLFPLNNGQLWASLAAYYDRGEADIDRGYLNAGLPEKSSASPDTMSWALKAHIEWDNAFQAKDIRFNPYASISYIKSEIDAYTETGGGFLAEFDKNTHDATELRLGVHALAMVNEKIRIKAQLEGVHLYADEGYKVSGTVIGLSRFNFTGSKLDDNWARAGLGVEYDVGGGQLSLMVNGTTQGEVLSSWASVNYQYTF